MELRRSIRPEGNYKGCPYIGDITVAFGNALGLGDDKPADSCII